MIPRAARIPGKAISELKLKTAARSLCFIVKTAPSHAGAFRFAIVVGKNVDARSVRRHALKRRIAHVVLMHNFGPCDMVIIVLPAANTLSIKDFAQEFKNILSRINYKLKA